MARLSKPDPVKTNVKVSVRPTPIPSVGDPPPSQLLPLAPPTSKAPNGDAGIVLSNAESPIRPKFVSVLPSVADVILSPGLLNADHLQISWR